MNEYLPHSPELTVARTAAEAGAAVLRRTFQSGLAMRRKADRSLVSDADCQSEQDIAAVIQEHFPDHAILGEELHQDSIDAPHLWVIDPLDGTNNFAHGVPHFAISIGYYRDGQAHSALIHDPINDLWFTAVAGEGAYHNDQPIRVSTAETLEDSLVGTGFYYDRGERMDATLGAVRELFCKNVCGIRRFGTASLDLCQVAMGRFGGFFEYELAPWDFAAGRLLVEEAGGRISTCTGEPLPLRSSTVLASNGLLHDAILAITTQHWIGEPAVS